MVQRKRSTGSGSNRPTPAELLTNARAGDADAFVRLIYTHRDSLRALAFSVVRDPSLLDDIMQEAFIKGFRNVGSLRNETSFKTWIHRIVYTTALDETRRRKNIVPMTNENFEHVVDPTVSIAERVSDNLHVNDVLFALPEVQRAAVLLVDGYGFDFATAAEVLAIPQGTAATRVRTARAAIKSAFHSTEDGDE